MNELMKRAARKILEARGFELRRVNYKFEPRKENRFKWIKDLNIRTVLDVGANTGQFAGEIHAILPEAAIYSFEPLRQCYGLLVEKMRHVPKFRAFDFALGSEASEIDMHRSEFTPSSSILRMNELHKRARARDGFLLDGRWLERNGYRTGHTGIPATVLLGVATYIGVRALPCRSLVGFCD